MAQPTHKSPMKQKSATEQNRTSNLLGGKKVGVDN